MYKRIVLFFMFLGFAFGAFAQETDTTKVEEPAEVPVISYSSPPKKYKIADIKVTGIKNYDDFVLIGFSGLSVGDEVTIPEPGGAITDAVKRFWKHGLFSDVKILATKIEGDQVWLEIQLKQRPRISEVNYHGIKKGEREDLEARLGLRKGYQVTPNLIDRATTLIKKFFDGKGFKNVDVEILQKDDIAHEGEVIVDININKNEKTKIHKIHFEGNSALTDRDLKKAMKKTNEKFSLFNDWKSSILEAFSTKKFTTEEYENDKKHIIEKYNEKGYRDAVLVEDSVVNYNDKRVDIFLKVEEGDKYYLKDINFVGNTKYPTEQLLYILGMKPGDVYNQKKLNERLTTDEDAVSNLYYNNGYIFFGADPVEVDVENDSISLEVRIQEGPQATINRVIINGNDRLYEDIVRRELRTKPGMLFSRDDLMRSTREIAQMGHFDPENLVPQPIPDPDNGTVDIQYNLVSKANDQIEFSAGWGQTGVIGKLSLKFTNFSMKNLLNPSTYKGIIPQGEGQTLTLSGQTNGRYYQAYSISFMDPWFGGKRPNTLSVSAYFSKQTDISSNYLSKNSYGYNPYYGYGGYPYYGWGWNSWYGPSWSFGWGGWYGGGWWGHHHHHHYHPGYYPGGGGHWGGGHWGNAYTNRRSYGPSRSSYAGNRVSSSTSRRSSTVNGGQTVRRSSTTSGQVRRSSTGTSTRRVVGTRSSSTVRSSSSATRSSVNRSSAASTRRSTYTRPSSTRSSSYNSSVEGVRSSRSSGVRSSVGTSTRSRTSSTYNRGSSAAPARSYSNDNNRSSSRSYSAPVRSSSSTRSSSSFSSGSSSRSSYSSGGGGGASRSSGGGGSRRR